MILKIPILLEILNVIFIILNGNVVLDMYLEILKHVKIVKKIKKK